MSPNDPLPTFRPSLYLLPTRSSNPVLDALMMITPHAHARSSPRERVRTPLRSRAREKLNPTRSARASRARRTIPTPLSRADRRRASLERARHAQKYTPPRCALSVVRATRARRREDAVRLLTRSRDRAVAWAIAAAVRSIDRISRDRYRDRWNFARDRYWVSIEWRGHRSMC